jgi:hypothetical protein
MSARVSRSPRRTPWAARVRATTRSCSPADLPAHHSRTLTVSGTTVGSKVYNGTNAASLAGGSLGGVIGEDTVGLNQSGTFASTSAGTGIAVTATDTLSGASAGNYSIAEPTGLTGSILPASSPPGVSSASKGLMLAALNARTAIVESLIYPQLGANPQSINASPTIAVLATARGGRPGDWSPPSHRGERVDEDRRERHLEDRERWAASAEQSGDRQ